MVDRMLLTVPEAIALIAGRKSVVRKWLHAQGLVHDFGELGKRVKPDELKARIDALSPEAPPRPAHRRAADRRRGDAL